MPRCRTAAILLNDQRGSSLGSEPGAISFYQRQILVLALDRLRETAISVKLFVWQFGIQIWRYRLLTSNSTV